MILIYSPTQTNRLTYTLDVIFNHILKVDYKLTSLQDFIKKNNVPKLNYSTENLEYCLTIRPHNLLFEETMSPQKVDVDHSESLPHFFKTSNENKIKYDLLAATFFMVSRYEEYLPSVLDHHDRFQAENSIAYQHGFLEKPVVNLWALELKKEIQTQFPSFEFPKQNYQYLNTFDIDVAYAYKGKNILRLFSSTLQSILKWNIADLKYRFLYSLNRKKDPYDVYTKIEKLETTYKPKSIYFFLMGNYAQFDKNLSHHSTVYQNLIRKTFKKNSIGIHPSYQSNKDKKHLSLEINRLQSITNSPVEKSRQHFLKLKLPETYENLIRHNIKEDYSMGFASQVGFRSGICTPYPFFNLKKNEQQDLKIVPFQVMDGTLNQYLKLSPIEAIDKIKYIVNSIREVDGLFVSLWHNSSLSEMYEWENWTNVYEELLKISPQINDK